MLQSLVADFIFGLCFAWQTDDILCIQNVKTKTNNQQV